MEGHKLSRKLNTTASALKKWNWQHFGFANIQITELELELKQNQFDQVGDIDKICCMEKDLKEQRTRLDNILKQKSCEIWLREGDRNTKFFHANIQIQRRRNRILAVKDEGVWLKYTPKIANYFLRNFGEVFESSRPSFPEELKELGGQYATEKENRELMHIPTTKKIKSCDWNLHSLKALGPDGFSESFFRSYWPTIQDQVVKFIQ